MNISPVVASPFSLCNNVHRECADLIWYTIVRIKKVKYHVYQNMSCAVAHHFFFNLLPASHTSTSGKQFSLWDWLRVREWEWQSEWLRMTEWLIASCEWKSTLVLSTASVYMHVWCVARLGSEWGCDSTWSMMLQITTQYFLTQCTNVYLHT